jgi:hypothetical protein
MNATHETVRSLRQQLDALRVARAPYAKRVALSDAIRKAEREAGPEPRMVAPPARCCELATVSYGCTCSHVTTCPTHGTRHHGTHD